MGKLKKFVEWVNRNFIIKWVVGVFFILVGLAGMILPIIQGLPILILGLAILSPTGKFSEALFKHEKAITWSLIIAGWIMSVAAVLYGYELYESKFGEISLQILQVGQQPLAMFSQNVGNATLSFIGLR